MALVRRSSSPVELDPFDVDLLDWPFRPLGRLRRLLEQEEVKVEEFTEGGQLVVRAELPGVDPDKDIEISIEGGNLCIRAERRQEDKVEGRNYRRTEIRYGSFARVLPLPPSAREQDIKATYKNGILEVRAPLDDSSKKTSRIPVTTS